MRKKMLYTLIALIALVGAGLLMVACNKGGDSPTMSSNIPSGSSATPSSGGTASAPTPVSGPTTGIAVTLVSTTFNPNSMCTILVDEKGNKTSYGNLSELVEVATITNNTDREVYPKPALFHSDTAGCGATDENPGGVVGLVTGGNIAAGGSANWTHRFVIPERACGRYQFDNDAFNGEIRKPTLQGGVGGVVINTGIDCPSCAAFDVQLTITGEGLTRTVSVTFKGQKPAKKALVDFGDGTSTELTNGGSVSHTWPYGDFIVTAKLNADDIECSKSAKVSNTKPCEVQWIEQEPEVTYGEWGECKKPETSARNGEPACSQSRSVRTVIKEKNSCTGEVRVKSDKTTTESRPCECKQDSCENHPPPPITGDISSDIQATQVVFDKGTVGPAGGTFNPTLPSTVARPKAGDPAGSFSTTYSYIYYPELQCKVNKEFTKSVPPKGDSCDNYTKPTFGGALALTSQTATQVTVTSGSVTPAGGSFNPSLPSVQTRPAPGSGDKDFSVDYTVSYGPSELNCKAEHEYSIKIPQQEEQKECMLVLSKDNDPDGTVKPGDYIKYSLAVVNEGDANCTGGGVKIDDDIPANIEYAGSSGTVDQCNWLGVSGNAVHWNCGTVAPRKSITVSWKGKVLNPQGNCNDFTITNKASAWSLEKGTIYSDTVSNPVDVTCVTCTPVHMDLPDGCYKPNPWGSGNNPSDVCGYFGLAATAKDEVSQGGASWTLTHSASMAVAHWGGADCSQGAQYYQFVNPASAGQTINSPGKGGISYVQYCACPAQAASIQRTR